MAKHENLNDRLLVLSAEELRQLIAIILPVLASDYVDDEATRALIAKLINAPEISDCYLTLRRGIHGRKEEIPT